MPGSTAPIWAVLSSNPRTRQSIFSTVSRQHLGSICLNSFFSHLKGRRLPRPCVRVASPSPHVAERNNTFSKTGFVLAAQAAHITFANAANLIGPDRRLLHLSENSGHEPVIRSHGRITSAAPFQLLLPPRLPLGQTGSQRRHNAQGCQTRPARIERIHHMVPKTKDPGEAVLGFTP